jgi:TRAP-type C4-dicarboxylate transport system substrate-binding protein
VGFARDLVRAEDPERGRAARDLDDDHEQAARDDEDLLGKIKAAGVQVNTPDKDAFVKASAPVYADIAKEVPGSKEVIDRAIALGK